MTNHTGGAHGEHGFTLVELVVVVAILAILAGVALTEFRRHAMRARRVEAVVGLESIYATQVSYQGLNGIYGDTFDDIGFSLEGGTRVDERTIRGRVYTFTLKATALYGSPRGGFQALASADLDGGDSVADILMIENFVPAPP